MAGFVSVPADRRDVPIHHSPPSPVAVTAIGVASYLTFQSFEFEVAKGGGHNQRQFNVLCGENPPTIIDGYGKWNTIDRPLRQGLTIPAGFNPARVQVEVRFGIWDGRFGWSGWDTRPIAAKKVEDDIDNLHWMAGGNFEGGPSPVVYIAQYLPSKGNLVQGDLWPRQYRGVPWIIDQGITWGASWRDKFGSRIYQEASFSVMGYTPAKGSSPVPRQQTSLAGGYFIANKQIRTARGIAAAKSSRSPEALITTLAGKICKSPRNNPCKGPPPGLHLARRSLDWPIPVHCAVWVPQHAI